VSDYGDSIKITEIENNELFVLVTDHMDLSLKELKLYH